MNKKIFRSSVAVALVVLLSSIVQINCKASLKVRLIILLTLLKIKDLIILKILLTVISV